MVYFAYRYGWRGASLALLVLALTQAINMTSGVFPGVNSRNLLLLDLSGFMALLLGSAMDAQRRSRRALQRKNLELHQLGSQLRNAARRNLQLEERQLKRVAGALHDELGQGLTAMRTYLKLADSRLQRAGLQDTGAALDGLVGEMRNSVRRLMNTLRPSALDEVGLIPVLQNGPIANFIRQAGIDYRFTCLDGTDLASELDPQLAIAVYRIAQESATNCVRHAKAREFSLCLELSRHINELKVMLEACDDGIGVPVESLGSSAGRGLQGMRDRVLAFGGVMRVRNRMPGTSIRVWFSQKVA